MPDGLRAVEPEGVPRFPALLDPRIAQFLETEPERLHGLVRRWGSPLNLVWPHTVGQNADIMRHVLEAHGVDFAIYYGAKVNKSQALVRAAVTAGIGIDASSLAEFDDALRAGVDPAQVCGTGPAKTAAFHRALLEAGSLVAVDSLEEFADLEAECAEGAVARVLLRLRPRSERGSRFGMDHDRLLETLRRLAATPRMAFEGFQVHLASYDVADRVAAMEELAGLVERAAELRLTASTIDIGGGLPIRYVDPDIYDAALRGQQPEAYRTAQVPASFYPYGSRETSASWLAAFLSAPCRGDTVAAYLRGKGLCLAIEPGRSLVDQGAISVFRINRIKPLGDGTSVIFVEGSSFSACETWCNSEFLIDPICVPVSPRASGSGAIRAYIAGHSCLGEDVLSNRIMDFAAAPRPGDLLVYANTAGYQMDLLENEFHRHPMPVRLIARSSAAGLVFVQDK